MIDFKLIQLKHKPNKFDEYPIYLRLTKDRKVKYTSSGIYCKLKEWNEAKSVINYQNPKNKKLNAALDSFEYEKTYKYKELTPEQKLNISLDEYLELLKPKAKSIQSNDLFDLIDYKINLLKETQKHGTAKYYHDTRNSIELFNGSDKLKIEKVNMDWLKKYEHFLRLRNCIDSGIAVRMRAIRAIFNDAISLDIVSSEVYPFGKKYKIHSLKGVRNIRAITIEDIQAINQLDTIAHPELKLSKDIFLFSYYAGGINFKDIMLLKHSSVTKDYKLIYIRSKTKGYFDFKLNEKARAIVDEYRLNKINTQYLFPILLSDNMTPIQIEYRKHKTMTKFNRDLKEIGRLCNIDFDLTGYVARHSFASNLKDMGVATDIISEALGHQNINITQSYLKRLNNEVIENAMDKMK
jgi:integrase/recombinase XerD